MEEKTKKKHEKRAWVKPAAIIFFIVMMVLTFFSNTIMNISLAEVSTQQIASGTVTTKVRGIGTVVSSKTYDVVLSETRKVEEIKVSIGDTVKTGDVLLTLEESENTELKEAQEVLKELNLAYQEAVLNANLSDYTAESNAVSRAERSLAKAKTEQSAFGKSTMTVQQATEALRIANAKVAEITAHKTSLENQLAALDEEDSSRKSLTKQITKVTTKLESAEAAARAAQNTLDDETNIATAEAAVESAEQALEDAKLALSQAVEANEKQSTINDLNLSAQKDKITAQEELVAKLTENTVGTELTAEYGGMVTAVNVTAGTYATPETILAQIAISEEGYSAEITITKEQAKEVKVGDMAEVSSDSHLSGEITATVSSIKDSVVSTEKDTGIVNGTGKTVVLRLEGDDLIIGETLNFTLSQKSTDYDTLVPVSAVNTDSSGTFILMITEKSTPLGTRYVATRVIVTVIKSDDINSAVSGSISGYGSVITAASKIVEPGDYVRLAGNE